MIKTFKNEKVLEFYKELPFNIYDNVDEATENIKKNNPIKIYTPLKEILVENKLINGHYLYYIKNVYQKQITIGVLQEVH